MIEFPFDGIEGFLSAEDRQNLVLLADRCSTIPGYMVEIGSYKGLSACCLTSGAPNKFLACLDWFEPEKLAEFWHNMVEAGIAGRTLVWAGDFKTQDVDRIGRSFCLVFVDHTHTLADTVAAYCMFWPRLSRGGVMAFHDYRHADYMEPVAWLDSLPHKRILEGSILALLKE